MNERAATGEWPKWQERWDRLIEAPAIIRQLWTGQPVRHQGRYYNVDAKPYDPPPQPIPLLTAANGKKSMRLAGQHGDGPITDPHTWAEHKAEWQAGARAAGKNPADMPVLVEQYVVVGGEAEVAWCSHMDRRPRQLQTPLPTFVAYRRGATCDTSRTAPRDALVVSAA